MKQNAVYLLFVLALELPLSAGFVTFHKRVAFSPLRATSETNNAAAAKETSPVDVTDSFNNTWFSEEAKVLEFTLTNHKPLGCTVEESLAHPIEKHVFISKVVEDGFAHQAGLEVGDVLLAVSGIFGDYTDVPSLGIEKVKSMVAGRPPDETLQIRIARGTNVLEKHETALVDLCMIPGANDKEVEDCVTKIMSAAYGVEEEIVQECNDEDECLLDDMFDMWNEELPPTHKETEPVESEQEETPEPRPWSSRSSPSGTYARDPATGEMRRI